MGTIAWLDHPNGKGDLYSKIQIEMHLPKRSVWKPVSTALPSVLNREDVYFALGV